MTYSPTGHDAGWAAQARERFLSAESFGAATVREPIRQSWLRSRELQVQADRLETRYIRDPNPESPLMIAAAPVLRQLAENLSAEPVGLVLTSADGVVSQRVGSDRQILKALDGVQLAQGYSYAEQFVGTNGIGTALETRMPAIVSGEEHYAEGLRGLTCAGVPIMHPVSGKLLGALDLTSWVRNDSSLLLTLAKTAARQVQDQILAQANEGETALLNAYLKACQRSQLGILALGGDVVLMNRQIRASLDAQDQVSLLEYALDSMSVPGAKTFVAALPSGRAVKLAVATLVDPSVRDGVVFHVHLSQPAAPGVPPTRPQLTGLAGTSASWLQCCHEVVRCWRERDWVLVSGEAGSGRVTLLRAVAEQYGGGSVLRTVGRRDFPTGEEFLAAVATETSRDDFRLLIPHIDALEHDLLEPLSMILQDCGGAGWVAATIDSGSQAPEVEAILVPFFSRTVSVPPLRHRIDDLRDLVPHLLKRVGKGADVALSPGALHHLSKYTWPGNIRQLRRVLGEVVLRQRSGIADIEQLPAEVRALSRRRLSPIEAMERDAIVRALAENGGNKTDAATSLGMSRATIYRKQRLYGIT